LWRETLKNTASLFGTNGRFNGSVGRGWRSATGRVRHSRRVGTMAFGQSGESMLNDVAW